MSPGEDLRVGVGAEQRDGLLHRAGSGVVERGGNHDAPPSCCAGVAPSGPPLTPGDPLVASWIARQTRSGDAGLPTSVTPRCDTASITALMTAGGEAMVPARSEERRVGKEWRCRGERAR